VQKHSKQMMQLQSIKKYDTCCSGSHQMLAKADLLYYVHTIMESPCVSEWLFCCAGPVFTVEKEDAL
jgi:hypothetical protein